MLSPGEFWQQVPRDLHGNLRWREHVYQAAKHDPEVQQSLRVICARDILFFINTFVFTYDPETESKVIPFITWPAQEKAFISTDPLEPGILWCIENRYDLAMEKSRRQGGSWINILAMDWLWRFHPYNQFLLISRNEEMVDGPSPDSLFWKLDFIDKYLPRWLMPREIKRTRRYKENVDNGSTVTGQATTKKAGVGGRATAMFIDEFARIDEDQEVLDGTADTSRCRIFNSTHTGPGTAFYRLCERENVKKLRLHWSQNPNCNKGLYRYDPETNQVVVLDKAYSYPLDFQFVMEAKPTGGPFPGLRSPWYDAECDRRGNSRAIAMDLDIDARGSMSQFFDSAMIATLVRNYAQDPWWTGRIDYDDKAQPKALIEESGGLVRLWVNLNHEGKPPKAKYGGGVDVGAGTGASPSVLSIVNDLGEKVLEFAASSMDPREFACHCVALCWLFKDEEGNPVKLVWEQVGPGLQFAAKLLELGYSNIWFNTREKPETLSTQQSERPGWLPEQKSKLLLLSDYREALHKRQLINRSLLALKECLHFRYTQSGDIEHANVASKDDPSGARVNHADRTIADALAWKMVKTLGLAQRKSEEQKILHPLSLAWRRQQYDNAQRELEVY